MKIIEAMKELKLIEKKLERNNDLIGKYSAQLSNERIYFGTKDAQEKEVKSLIQSSHDMVDNYIKLKLLVETTNLATKVELMGKKYTLAELLIHKRKTARMMINSFDSLTDNHAKSSLRMLPSADKISVERFYSESFKNENMRSWQDFYESIDARLEVVNATTDLVE